MFSKEFSEYARHKYSSRIPFMGTFKEEIEQKLGACTPEEQILMKFFYGTMPLRDLGEYDFEVFMGFVRHGLMVYQSMEWCRKLPEEIFLHNVLYYRVNSESIEDCRRFFYDQLIGRIQGKTLEEAVLEINYWCAENGAYEASDIRTISPLAMYHSSKGRCGEESTFAVTAFRSVGIPARQVYAPWWAHCDDNHAWVEVYVRGNWHFLGACEPEEALDQGWFADASSRSMLVHARDFSDYGNREPCVRQGEIPCYKNVTPRYAKTREFHVKVLDADGMPAERARVFVEVLNSAEYRSIAAIDTGPEGRASLCMGLGTVHLWAVKEGRTGEALINTKEQGEAALTLTEGSAREALMDRKEQGNAALTLAERGNKRESAAWADFDISAPEECAEHAARLTKAQKARSRERIQEAVALRAKRIDGYYEEMLAEKYPGEKEILRLAAGNFSQLYQFLDKDDNPGRKDLLHSLSEKDYKDAKAEVIEEHLRYASEYRAEWEERGELEIYISYILCPRIFFEEMAYYREGIQNHFSEEEKNRFRERPAAIWDYIKENIGYEESYDYSTIFSTPANTLKLGFGNPMSQRILCAAICRTLGIPARIHRVTREVEAYQDGGFVRLSGTKGEHEPAESATLALKRKEGEEWNYYQNWTIGQFRQGRFVTLDYQELEFKDMELKLELEPGYYRILTTNRLPKGDQLASECKIFLEQGQALEVELKLRAGRPEELLVSKQLEDFDVTEHGEVKPISALTKGRVHILAFLEPGEEPTEHVLNEISMHQESFGRLEAGICFILRSPAIQKTAAWEKAVKALPEVKAVYGSFDELVEPLARSMYADPKKLPLLIVINPGLQGIYACSGYRVGSVKMMLELLRMNQAKPDC